jgi:hypothetical protein
MGEGRRELQGGTKGDRMEINGTWWRAERIRNTRKVRLHAKK